MTQKSTYEPFKINIIGTGSSGNCVVIDNSIVIDCGLPIKKIGQTVINADAIFITHRHSDHLNLSILHHLYRKAPWKLTQSLYTVNRGSTRQSWWTTVVPAMEQHFLSFSSFFSFPLFFWFYEKTQN